MRIKGRKIELVDIDVDKDEIKKAAISLLKTSYKHLIKGDHIDSDGNWKVYEYTHPHSRDDEYSTGDKASEEEIHFQKMITMIEAL